MKPTIKKIKELDDDCIYEITREGSEEKVQIMIPWEYFNKHKEIKRIKLKDGSLLYNEYLNGKQRTFSIEPDPPYGLNLVFKGHYE